MATHNRKVKILLFLLLLCAFTRMLGQELPGDIPSPTVASLAKFGDIPVSLYTGTPQISIPIVELKSLDKSMPISLEYDASGFPINALPSWTGHNWTLQVGGVITRQRVGNYDDFIFPKQALSNRNFAKKCCHFCNYGRLKRFMQTKDNNELNPYYDQGPDIFIFNFMGYSGKFFLGDDGQWKVQSNENLDINFNVSNFENDNQAFQHTPFMYPKSSAAEIEPKTITGFVIRDSQGYQYVFGYDKNAVEYAHSFFNMSKNEEVYAWHASSWYLTAVYDKYGRNLYSLSYTRGTYVIQAYNSYCLLSSAEHTEFGDFPHHGFDSGVSSNSDRFPYGFSVSSPVYLSRITNKAGVVVSFSFSYPIYLQANVMYGSLYNKYGVNLVHSEKVRKLYNDLASRVSGWGNDPSLWKNDNPASSAFYQPGAFYFLQNKKFEKFRLANADSLDILAYSGIAQLNSISIYSKEGGRKYDFFYQSGDRMLLTHIMITSGSNWQHSRQDMGYDFSYNDPQLLPKDYLTTQTDHWGYYNGVGYNKSPLENGDYTGFYELKAPDAKKCKLGMLREITYPTGGTTEIEYEPNDYSISLSLDRQTAISELSNQLGGGVRVKTITNWSSPRHEQMLKKTMYKYINPRTGLSSGELFAKPKYYWKDWKVNTDKNSYVMLSTFRTCSVIPLANAFGSHLGYSYVEEIDSVDGSKTDYCYNSLTSIKKDQKFDFSFLTENEVTPVDKYTERGYERGLLQNERSYDSNGKLVKSIGYRYDEGNESNSVFTSNISRYYGHLSDANSFFMGGVYRILYPKLKIQEIADTVFYTSGNIVSLETRENKETQLELISPYRHVVDVKLLQSKSTSGGGLNVVESYTYPNCGETSPNGYQIGMYFDLAPESVSKSVDGQFVSRNFSEYKEFTRQTGKMHSETSYVPSLQCIQYSNGVIDTLVNFSSYYMDCSLNSYVKKGELPTYIVWGYNDSFPISIQKGGQALNPYLYTINWNVLNLYDPRDHVEDIKGAIVGNKNPGAAYIYSPLFGLTQKIETNGNITYYQYDGLGRLIKVLDKNNKLLQQYDYSYKKNY